MFDTAPQAEVAQEKPVIISRNPATGEALGEVPVMDLTAVDEAVARARSAQRYWADVDIERRCEMVLTFRDALVEDTDAFCEAISLENGKPRVEALVHDVLSVADLCTFFAKRGPEFLAPRRISLHLLKHRASYIHYVPRGVVGVIGPWNFPFALPFGPTIMSLIAGNAVVIKPSEWSPLIALRAKALFDRVGLPPDLVQIVTGYGETGAALIEARVDHMVFIGSVRTGRRVAAACGERLIPCTLELGGKAPAIVCADADLERTARALVWGAFANAGQVCASVERVFAASPIHDALVARVTELANALRQGDPQRFDTDVGATCFPRQLEVAEALIEDAVAKGAKVVTGGKRGEGPGQFFPPTVLADVQTDMRILHEESFSPLMPIMRVRDEEEAIALANETRYGLLAYVFTRDRAKGRRIAERVEAGTVMVNDVLSTYGAPETPWSGVKDSGIGRIHSDDGLRDLCQARHVNYDLIGPLKRELWWYPYDERIYTWGKKALRFLFGGTRHRRQS